MLEKWSIKVMKVPPIFTGFLRNSLRLLLFCATLATGAVQGKETGPTNLDSATLFNLTNIWTVHFKFTPDQWEALEPKGGNGPFGGRGGPGGFGPGMFLAPAFLAQADSNKDGKLSQAEFQALANVGSISTACE